MDGSQTEQDKRRADVRAAIKVMQSPIGLALTVDVEDSYLLSDAIRCYINGADAGTIFCIHAACERDLAAMVSASGSAPTGSHRWGLGNLISYCVEHELMPRDLLDNLHILNDHRKTLYHYGHSESDTALRQRMYDHIKEVGTSKLYEDFKEQHGREGGNKEIYTFALDRVLQRSALSALLMLRSWLAPFELSVTSKRDECDAGPAPS